MANEDSDKIWKKAKKFSSNQPTAGSPKKPETKYRTDFIYEGAKLLCPEEEKGIKVFGSCATHSDFSGARMSLTWIPSGKPTSKKKNGVKNYNHPCI